MTVKCSRKESSLYGVEQSEAEGEREVNLRTDKQKTGLMGDLEIYNDGFWGELVYLLLFYILLFGDRVWHCIPDWAGTLYEA